MNKLIEKLKRNTASQKLPSKRNINLYIREKDGNSLQVVLPLAVFLAVIIFAIYRLGVVDRLAKLAQLQQQNSALNTQLEQLEEKASAYDEVLEEYRRFTTSYLADDEKGIVSRERVFDMIDESVEGIGSVDSISIEGNQVGVTVEMSSLEDIDTIQDRLNSMDNINEIMVSTAKGTNNVDVEGYIIFTVKEDDDSRSSYTDAYGNMTEAERAARYEEYTNAVKAARDAENSAERESDTKKAESVYGSSKETVNNSIDSGRQQNTSSAQTGSGKTEENAAASGSGSQAQVQNIGGDTVVVGSNPENAPMGFSSLEEGMAAVQGAGQ